MLNRQKHHFHYCRAGLISLMIFVLLAAGSLPASGQNLSKDQFASRLAKLAERLEAERENHHIPGLAIAVVKDDQIVMSKGFGYSDIAHKRPVAPETLFAVGSTTKAFTATLIGMLVDESKMAWDDPVDKHIPDFRLQVDTGDDQITLRDLLCHRTGFTRMSILWAAGRLSRLEVLELAGRAQPYADFREKFLYNNAMYMAAGHAAGRAAHSDWDALLAARIFQPLHMNASSTSIADVQPDPRLAKGYIWDQDQQAHQPRPMRNLDAIGPAGSINSNVVDMAQWVRFQLGRGEYEGQRLLSAGSHAETWQQQIEMAPGVGYGLGWMLREWNGKPVIEHGGSTDGFAAQVSLLPEHNLGYVLLANVTATPLQQQSIDVVFSALVGDPPAGSETVERAAVAGLLGKYVANFGPFRDERFTVLIRDGKLSIDVPGQQVYELKQPDVEDKWYFALTSQVAVSFQRDNAGEGVSLTMYQRGFAFECPREGVEYAVEVPLDELQQLVGTYRHEQSQRELKVIIVNNRLALDDRGIFELAPPDDEHRWAIRANRNLAQIRFNRGEDELINSLSRFRRGKEMKLTRVTDEAAAAIPTVKALMTRMRLAVGADQIANLGHVRMTGTVDFVHQGGHGTVTQWIAGLDQFKIHTELAKLGSIQVAYDGHRGWTNSSFGPFEELSGSRLAQLRLRHPLWVLQDWMQVFDSAVILRSDTVDGQRVLLLRLSGADVPTRTLAVSADSGLVLMEKTAEIAPGIGAVPVTLAYADYRPVNGVMLPFKVTSKAQQTGEIVVEFKAATPMAEPSDQHFRLTRPLGSPDSGSAGR